MANVSQFEKQELNVTLCPNQTQVGGKKTSVLLPKLTPDTEYSISVAAVYPKGVSKDLNGLGKTSKLP